MPRKGDNKAGPTQAILPGDSGIWASCQKGREGKCIGELRDLFNEYAEILYPAEDLDPTDADEPDSNDVDIEAEINAEVSDIQKPPSDPLFTLAKTDTPCGTSAVRKTCGLY